VTNGVSWIKDVDGSSRNLLINGSFDIWQHGLATVLSSTSPANSDDIYVTDMWTLLSDGNNVMNCWTSANGAAGRGGMLGLQTQTANKKAGLIQFVENAIAYPAIGQVVSLRFSAFTPSAHPNANLMAAVLSWSSTSDTLTSDVVSSWEATNTRPTLIANWTYENTPARLALVNDTWTEYKIENIAIDTASTTNIAVFIWLDDTDSTSGDLVYISGVQLNIGAKCLPWSARGYTQEMTACKRYYMVGNSDATAYGHWGISIANDAQYGYSEYRHPTAFFKTGAAVTSVGNWTLYESFATESLTSLIVVRGSDDAKGLTAGHSYLVYAANDTTARIFVSSRL
jgi:hypothetical protein